MHERRRDPRTSKPFSLSNLLRTRAEREGWMLAVVGDDSGMLMGSSRPQGDRQSERIAAHVSAELFPGKRDQILRVAPTWPGVRLVATRLDVGPKSVSVSIMVDQSSRSSDLDELMTSVRRILTEPPSRLEAAA